MINNIKGIECVLFHLTDSRLTNEFANYYKKNSKNKSVFNKNELKRTQFNINLAEGIIGDDIQSSIADIGPGLRIFTGFMCEKKYKKVTAIDIKYYEGFNIETSNFSFVNSTIEKINDSYDYTFCFEVLEHNSLKSLEKNITKIKSITNKKAIISLPYYEDPIKTTGHNFTLTTEVIHKHFQGSSVYMLYREDGFSYIYFIFDCSGERQMADSKKTPK
jgi:hypothetical protein